MTTQAQLKAQSKYDRNHTRSILLKLNLQSDADILSKLDAEGNRQGYVKELIRQDIRKELETIPVNALRYLILPVVKKNDIKAVYLFGSYARGEATPESDIDLLIDGGNIHTIAEYFSVVSQFEKALGKKIDVVMAEAAYQDNSRAGKRFMEHFQRDKVTLYEAAE